MIILQSRIKHVRGSKNLTDGIDAMLNNISEYQKISIGMNI